MTFCGLYVVCKEFYGILYGIVWNFDVSPFTALIVTLMVSFLFTSHPSLIFDTS